MGDTFDNDTGLPVITVLHSLRYASPYQDVCDDIDYAKRLAEVHIESNFAAPYAITVNGDVVLVHNPPEYEWREPTEDEARDVRGTIKYGVDIWRGMRRQ